jgi:hypothetical protein
MLPPKFGIFMADGVIWKEADKKVLLARTV